MSITSIIPFHDKSNKFVRSNFDERRWDNLFSCINNLTTFSDKIIVGVLDETVSDKIETQNMSDKLEIWEINIGADINEYAYVLPATLMQLAQEEEIDTDYILVAEADMVFSHPFYDISTLANDDILVAHKLEKAFKDYVTRGTNSKAPWFYTTEQPETVIINGEKYACPQRDNVYGGNFLCKPELFMKADFTIQHALPIEHALGLAIFEHGNVVKTQTYDGFYVENLQGYSYNEENYYRQRYLARNRNFMNVFPWITHPDFFEKYNPKV